MSAATVPAAPGPDVAGWLNWFDLFVINTSGGKDSQTALRAAVRALETADALGRTLVQHNDLGERVEWPEVPQLAAVQAARYGLDVHYTSRPGGDLLDDIATRKRQDGTSRGFPALHLRWCTSDHKTAPSRRFIEAACARIRDEQRLNRPVRVLQVIGYRAGESGKRAGLAPFGFNDRQSATTKRHVYDWYPVLNLTEAQVWNDIRASGVPYHPVYDLGMPRLSCRFCVLAGVDALALAKALSPDVAAEYETVEQAIGQPFRNDRSRPRTLASIAPAAGVEPLAVHWSTCPTCAVPVLALDREPVRHCPAHAANGPWNTFTDPDAQPEPACGFVSGWAARPSPLTPSHKPKGALQ